MSSNWSMSEDVQLCISYCRQSVDPISGSKQKVDKLWEKIHLDFHDGWLLGGNQPRAEARSQAALASHFAKLKPMLVYWGSYLSYAERNRESGCNMQDEIRKAQTMYISKKNKEFKHFACWEEVKAHQTFARIETSTPPTYTYEANADINEVLVNEVPPSLSIDDLTFSTPESYTGGSSSPVRPPGVKAAKEARRKGKYAATKSTQRRDDVLETMANNQKEHMNWQREQAKRAQQIQQDAINVRKLEEDTKIMQMNTEMMTPTSKRYFSKRKAAPPI
ncbi:unnamed protein product [Rhodiola kirilowii]